MFGLALALAVPSCGEGTYDERLAKMEPPVYVPPAADVRSAGFVEVQRFFGALGGITLEGIDGKRVLLPGYLQPGSYADRYAAGTKRVPAEGDTEQVFIAVSKGRHDLLFTHLPGLTTRIFNPFAQHVLIAAGAMTATIRAGHSYRGFAEEVIPDKAYRIWLTDLTTGETVASTLIH